MVAPTAVSAQKAATVSGPSSCGRTVSDSLFSTAAARLERALTDLELGLQLVLQPLHKLLLGLVGLGVPVGVGGGDVVEGGVVEQRGVDGASGGVVAEGEGAEGVAVVAHVAGDEVLALGLADFAPVLAGHLDAGLHGLRAAREEEHFGKGAVGVLYHAGGEGFGGWVGEGAGVGEGELLDLVADGFEDFGVSGAQLWFGIGWLKVNQCTAKASLCVCLPAGRSLTQATAAPPC